MAKNKTLTRDGKTYTPCYERRRYGGRMTYTWLLGFDCSDGSFVKYAGDPWPCVVPPLKEIEETLDRTLKTA